MTTKSVDPQHGSFTMKGAKVAVLGYGAAAREHALGLRRAGNDVAIGLRLGGMSWVRAREDGFFAHAPSVVVSDAEVVVVLVPDDEQTSVYYHALEPNLRPGALVVFGRAVALEIGAFVPSRVDVVLVAGDAGRAKPRVAVHHDATGRALERAIAYAHAAFGENTAVGTTTLEAEADAELAALSERAGSVPALLEEVERSASRVRETHAPDEAKVAFYEGLQELVAKRVPESSAAPVPCESGTSLLSNGQSSGDHVSSGRGARRGIA
jgi:ketol-acid reductoisomerase